jgi:hypothetical protein
LLSCGEPGDDRDGTRDVIFPLGESWSEEEALGEAGGSYTAKNDVWI